MKSNRFHYWPIILAKTIAAAITMVGATVLSGWALDLPSIKRVIPESPQMAAITALAFLLSGAALLAAPRIDGGPPWQRRLSRILASLVVVIGLFKLADYALGWNLNFDMLGFHDRTDPAGLHPKLMAPLTGLNFVLTGILLWLISTRHLIAVHQSLALVLAFIGWLGIEQFIYGGGSLLPFAPMAVHTAGCFILLGTALFCARTDGGAMALFISDTAGGTLARRLLLPLVLFIFAKNWIESFVSTVEQFDSPQRKVLYATSDLVVFGGLVWLNVLLLHRSDSARKEAETATFRANIYNRSLLEASLDPLITIRQDGKIADVNAAAESATGMKRSKLIGTDFSNYFTEPEKARAGYDRAFREGSVRDFPLELQHREGRSISVLFNASIYPDENGNVLGVLAAARDISELKKVEAALRAERQRFHDVLNHLPAYVILLSPDYHVPFANHFFEQRFGRSEGRRCYEYLFQRTSPCENCETYKVLKTHAPHHWEWTGPDHRNYDIYDQPFTDVDGSPLILEVGLDVTEARTARTALEKANAYNRSLIEASIDPLVTIGADGRITDANTATEIATGFSRSELVGTDFCDYFTDPVKARAGYQQAFREHSVKDYALELRHRDGHVISVLYNASVYRDESDEVLGVFAAARDITERKRNEEQIRVYAAELQRSNNDLERFAYVASHDLQEPLRSISNFSQLLGRRYQGKLGRDADDFIGFITDGATRMQALINDLLAFSRVGTRGQPFVRVNCELVLAQVKKNLEAAIAESGARITHDPLPTVPADVMQLTQVFQNLISNAIKFRKPKETPQIHLTATSANGAWQINISDNGIGIDPQFFKRLFIIFQRLHGRDEYPGTGIGLAICKKIVERHGGRIWVESQPEKGSTFSFTLPKEAKSYEEHPQSSPGH